MTCCDGLAAMAKLCGINIKGLTPTIEIAEACDVEVIPDPDAGTHTISTDMTVATGKQFFEWALADDAQLSFVSTAVGNANDMSFQNQLVAFIPGDTDEKDTVINAILNGSFVLRFGSKTGSKKLLGTIASPAKIVGCVFTNNSEQNGHLITFENMGYKPYNYTAAIPLTPVV